MLWNASALTGYSINATDGEIGTVKDLLFEDITWRLRWLVVATGPWLLGRKVLISHLTLEKPNEVDRSFAVALTKQQVKESPDVDTDRPVSRQQEASLFKHYDWSPYWVGAPEAAAAELQAKVSPELAPEKDGDPHLRSYKAVSGYRIEASDGEIGTVEDLLVDDEGLRVRYIVVSAETWWRGEKVLISPQSVFAIDAAAAEMRINVSREKVKGAPRYDPRVTVDGTYDTSFLSYYGIKWVSK
jgi:sporulation protein YlmC with PRC-barrel domain